MHKRKKQKTSNKAWAVISINNSVFLNAYYQNKTNKQKRYHRNIKFHEMKQVCDVAGIILSYPLFDKMIWPHLSRRSGLSRGYLSTVLSRALGRRTITTSKGNSKDCSRHRERHRFCGSHVPVVSRGRWRWNQVKWDTVLQKRYRSWCSDAISAFSLFWDAISAASDHQ